MSASELSDHERALIDFEREWWQLGSRKDVAIRARFEISASSYYRALHALIDRADAMQYDPLDRLALAQAARAGPTRPNRGSTRRSRDTVTHRGQAFGQNGDMNRPSGGNGDLVRGAGAAAMKGAALIGLAVIVGVFLLQRVDTSKPVPRAPR